MFRRVDVVHPYAKAVGWIATREGIEDDAQRGFGGQSRTARRVFDARPFDRCRIFGWVTYVRSTRPGGSRPVIEALLEKMVDADVDVVGLLVLPDDDAFIPRLMRYYATFGFVPFDDEPYGETAYPVMLLRATPCGSALR